MPAPVAPAPLIGLAPGVVEALALLLLIPAAPAVVDVAPPDAPPLAGAAVPEPEPPVEGPPRTTELVPPPPFDCATGATAPPYTADVSALAAPPAVNGGGTTMPRVSPLVSAPLLLHASSGSELPRRAMSKTIRIAGSLVAGDHSLLDTLPSYSPSKLLVEPRPARSGNS